MVVGSPSKGRSAASHVDTGDDDVDLESAPVVPDESPYFVVIGGGKPGVYESEAGAFDAVTSAGGSFEHCASKAHAQARHRRAMRELFPPSTPTKTADKTAFVVWRGRATGVMSRAACLRATQRVDSPKLKGPMSGDDAWIFWLSVEKTAEIVEDKPLTKRSKLHSGSAAKSETSSTA